MSRAITAKRAAQLERILQAKSRVDTAKERDIMRSLRRSCGAADTFTDAELTQLIRYAENPAQFHQNSLDEDTAMAISDGHSIEGDYKLMRDVLTNEQLFGLWDVLERAPGAAFNVLAEARKAAQKYALFDAETAKYDASINWIIRLQFRGIAKLYLERGQAETIRYIQDCHLKMTGSYVESDTVRKALDRIIEDAVSRLD